MTAMDSVNQGLKNNMSAVNTFYLFSRVTYKTQGRFKLFVLNSRKWISCYLSPFNDLKRSLKKAGKLPSYSQDFCSGGAHALTSQRLLLCVILTVKLHECVQGSQFKCAKECSLYAEQVMTNAI